MHSNDELEGTLGRRELLKALAAAGGALAAAAFLPGKWTRPVVEAGVLPAHAQASAAITISNLVVRIEVMQAARALADFYADFSYSDPLGQVDQNARLYGRVLECGQTVFGGETLAGLGAVRSGDGFSGKISVGFNQFCPPINSSSTLEITNMMVGGRGSNSIQDQYLPYPFPGK